jgi:hypothetical protein
MAVAQGFSKITTSGSVFMYDTADTVNSYKGEPTTNMWGIETGGNVNGRSGWDMPYAYNGAITNTVYSNGTWNGNRIWEVLHTLGTSGYAGYESWRLCVNQPTAGPSTYSTTRRVAIKICLLEGSITDMSLHTGGGNAAHNAGDWTPIPESQVPRDCPVKTGWYQFLADGSWNSNSVGHCVGLGFISYNRVKILTTEPMYYPSDHLIPFTGLTRSATQSLIPLISNSTLDLTNASFNSTGEISLDGSNDYIKASQNSNFYTNNWTWEMVVKFTANTGTYQGLVWAEGDTGGGSGLQYLLTLYSNAILHYRIYNTNSGWGYTDTANITFDPLKYNHITWQFNNGTTTIYINSVLFHTDTSRGAYSGGTNSPMFIGARNDGAYGAPMMPAVYKHYTRILTPGEILNNYNHYKTKYNLT